MSEFLKKISSIPKSIVSFFVSVREEMKRTEFPSKRQSWRMAGTILISSFIVSMTLFGIDALLILARTYLTNINK